MQEGGVIRLLPDSVANQIAAGEVIQRPASVIKELMENSIDAGAKEVKVVVQDAGRTLIMVTDDGCGMTETDARMSFERHATSKIREASDLYHLSTMGFRGEALASITAVAQVEMQTRVEGAELGTRVETAGCEIGAVEPCATPKGTRISVRNLFFNIPARRRFLKSDATEMRQVSQEFLRVALAHIDIDVSLVSDGQTIYKLSSGGIKQRIAGVVGTGMTQHLIPIEAETDLVKIKGFIGTPETAKKRGVEQFFFVNDRYMKSASFHKAIVDAYKGIIAVDVTPCYFVYIDVDPQTIDVNVSPQKTEIKFDDEQSIWKILNSAARKSLSDGGIMPSIDFESSERIEIPTFGVGSRDGETETYNPFAREREQAQRFASTVNGWERLYTGLEKAERTYSSSVGSYNPNVVERYDPFAMEASTAIQREMFPEAERGVIEIDSSRFWQHIGKYIITTVPNGLMIIDQHRAHNRILFDTYKQIMQHGNISGQMLLYPERVSMSQNDACIVSELQGELAQAGIDVTVEGNEIVISSTPTQIEISAVRDILEELVYDCQQGGADVRSGIGDYIIGKLAEKVAMPYGRELTAEEMKDMYEKLMTSAERGYTPQGKPTFRVVSNNDIERLF